MKHLGLAIPVGVFAVLAASACGSAGPTPTPLTQPAGPPPSIGWTPPAADPPAVAAKSCVASGCGGSQCVEAGTETAGAADCEAPPQAKCLAQTQAKCEAQADGQCGWSKSPELVACIDQVGASETPPPGKPPAKPGVVRLEVKQNATTGFGALAKPFIDVPNGVFPAPAIQLRVGTFVYTVASGRIQGVPAVSTPTPGTMVLTNGQEIPVELAPAGSP